MEVIRSVGGLVAIVGILIMIEGVMIDSLFLSTCLGLGIFIFGLAVTLIQK